MMCDFETDNVSIDRKFDVCIVGAGAAGLVLARKLIAEGREVLLIESGGRSRWERKSQALNRTRNVGHSYHGAHSGRFRAVGGTTSAWAGQILELDKMDFEHRPWVSSTSWPITKEDLRPYYRQAQYSEGISDLPSDEKIWETTGIQKPDLGSELHMAFSRHCPELRFSRLFSDVFADDKLTVLLHANAVEAVPSEDNASIQSLKIRSLGGKTASCKAATFVFCLGGIESSRFLLNQTFAPWNRSGLVGKHFQDHVHCYSADIEASNLAAPGWVFGPSLIDGKYPPKIKLTEAAQRQHKVLNASGIIEYSDRLHPTLRTGIKIVAGPTSTVSPGEFIRMLPGIPGVVWHRLKTRKNPQYVVPWAKPKLTVWCEQQPDSESSISLTSERDQTGLFRAAVDWKISEMEIKTIRTFTKLVASALGNGGIAKVVPDLKLQSDRLRDLLTDQFHHCGGTRMSRDPQSGVVDENLKLHGVANAYVCGASVFPTSGASNPTHTVLALALRLSDHLSVTHFSRA